MPLPGFRVPSAIAGVLRKSRASRPTSASNPVAVFQKEIRVSTRGRCHVFDITPDVDRIITASSIDVGIVNVSGTGSTLGITTLEFEPGCVSDLQRALEQIAPSDTNYAHNARWHDENGYAHLRSALVGTA